jgi:hypothetical protein
MANNCTPPTSTAFGITRAANAVFRSLQNVTKSRSSSQIPSNILTTPITSTLSSALTGTVLGGTVAAITASEFAKIGKKVAGTPGEISAAVVGAGTGAAGGFVVGSIVGAFSGQEVVNYYLTGLLDRSVGAGANGLGSQLASLTKFLDPSTYTQPGTVLKSQ